MPVLIENRPINCIHCGYGPNHGRESSTPIREGVHHEVRWTCARCGRLIRVDEKIERTPAKKEEKPAEEKKLVKEAYGVHEISGSADPEFIAFTDEVDEYIFDVDPRIETWEQLFKAWAAQPNFNLYKLSDIDEIMNTVGIENPETRDMIKGEASMVGMK